MCDPNMNTGDFTIKQDNVTDKTTFRNCGDGIQNRKFKDNAEPKVPCSNVLFDLSQQDENNVNKKKMFIRKANCCG